MKNQPAFPTLRQDKIHQNFLTTDGMTLRDYFAAKAMQALIQTDEQKIAWEAYRIADGMMEIREKRYG